MSVAELNYNDTEKSLEITIKIFTDDFENALAKQFQEKTDLIRPANPQRMDTLIKKYLMQHFQLRVNGKPVLLNYLGHEMDHEAVYCYAEVTQISSIKRLDIFCSILYNLFDDQINIFHIKAKGNKQSNRLVFPDKEIFFDFSI
ncbi:MAG: hypothetical protein N2747_00880 [Chitinophagaceae bacterium]|nr:hypothetical protein [Chitinophagaceae bacterium]